MRRLDGGVVAAVGRAWSRFLLDPVSTNPVAFVRIAVGIVATAWTATLYPDLREFFGPDGMLVEHPVFDWRWSVFRWWGSQAAVATVWAVLLLASVALTLGLGGRVAAVLVWLGILSFERRNPWVFNSGDLLLRQLTFFLVLAPVGAALSLDRWLRHRDRFWDAPARAPWPLRLIQLNLALGYLFSVWGKARGATWSDGTAIGYALRIQDVQRFPAPAFLTDVPIVVNALTWGALVVEGALAVLVWNRRLRPWVLLAGVALHLSIDVWLEVGFFSYAIFAAYLAFVPPEVADRVVAAVRAAVGGRGHAAADTVGVPPGEVAAPEAVSAPPGRPPTS